MLKNSKIFLTGHNGLVGSAVYKKLRFLKYKNIITVEKKNLDLRDEKKVDKYFSKKKNRYYYNGCSTCWRYFSK